MWRSPFLRKISWKRDSFTIVFHEMLRNFSEPLFWRWGNLCATSDSFHTKLREIIRTSETERQFSFSKFEKVLWDVFNNLFYTFKINLEKYEIYLEIWKISLQQFFNCRLPYSLQEGIWYRYCIFQAVFEPLKLNLKIWTWLLRGIQMFIQRSLSLSCKIH